MDTKNVAYTPQIETRWAVGAIQVSPKLLAIDSSQSANLRNRTVRSTQSLKILGKIISR